MRSASTAKITITTPAFGKFKVVLTSDKDGKWGTILNDSTIAYDYLVEAKGYIPIKQNKKVGIGSEGTLDVQLLTADQAVEKGLVKEVVDLMGGTITCQSEVGEGTRFTVTFDFPIAGPSETKKPEAPLSPTM